MVVVEGEGCREQELREFGGIEVGVQGTFESFVSPRGVESGGIGSMKGDIYSAQLLIMPLRENQAT